MIRFILLLAAFAACLPAQVQNPLRTLRKTHPRLILLDRDILRLRTLIQADPEAHRIYESLKEQAREIETQPPVEYKLIGPRLLDKSRRCLDRVYTLALLYRLDGNREYLERALKELHAAAAFPDWHPPHFLDTAEMTHAFAIGYDWLYPALSDADRRLFRNAIIEKGLDAAIPLYKQHGWWTISTFNWSQVCNGGITLGALAVAEDAPKRAEFIVSHSVESIKLAMASYEPDGGWAEGPGYWHYATRYNVYYLAGLQTALGTDFGLSKMQGFSHAGDFRIYFEGPSDGTFNYADAHDGIGNASEMFWLARRFSQPVYAWDEQQRLKKTKPDALDLVWYQRKGKSPKEAGWPLARVFTGVQVAFLRSDWEDPNAIFVGIKGGDNKANHSHLDLGTFVLDAMGVRWAMDLGPDNYNLPQYFGKLRWTYYRLRTESHNTVLIDGENQNTSAKAPILSHRFSPDLAEVKIDLTETYPEKLVRYTREMSLDHRRYVVVRDDIVARQPVEALWGMVTDAQVSLNGNRAELRKGQAALGAEIVSPRNAEFGVVSTAPPEPQNQNTGTRKLVIRLPAKITKTNIEVRFAPQAK